MKNDYMFKAVLQRVEDVETCEGREDWIKFEKYEDGYLIKVNFDNQIGLHTRTKQDSKNIIGFYGCEQLPKFGKCYVLNSNYNQPQIADINLIDESEINEIIQHWETWQKSTNYEPQKVKAYEIKPTETKESKIPLFRYLAVKEKYKNLWM